VEDASSNPERAGSNCCLPSQVIKEPGRPRPVLRDLQLPIRLLIRPG
jgi:hypothetical protein